VRFPLDVPIDVGRQEAADAARHELSKAIYADARPSLAQRVVSWIAKTILDALNSLVAVAPGGFLGLLALVVIVVVVVLVVRRRMGPLHRANAADLPVFVGRLRSAAEYRAAADTAAARGDWDEAVRQRFRAIVRSLEERDVLEPRAGRTADEAVSAAARALPSCAHALGEAARSFDDIAYGSHPRDQGADAALRVLDTELAATRPLYELDPTR
jgi:Domain of unknown function (DUF4129)